jgi:hypothetical protein
MVISPLGVSLDTVTEHIELGRELVYHPPATENLVLTMLHLLTQNLVQISGPSAVLLFIKQMKMIKYGFVFLIGLTLS